MAIYKKVTDLVGNTPILELGNYEEKNQLEATILAKLEYFNPAGSVKDRIAREIILDALETGKLTKDSVIIEPTSGNTGIGLERGFPHRHRHAGDDERGAPQPDESVWR